jgi:hypothetical protein
MADNSKYKTVDGVWLPLEFRNLNLYAWFESDILLGVIENAAIPLNPSQQEIERFMMAANHYREYDDFYDYPVAS